MNSSEKIFYIDVDFKSKTAKLQPKINNPSQYLFTFSEAQKRTQQIQHLFKDDKWAKHYDLEITELRFQIISDFIKFNKTLQEIKRNFH